MHRSTPRVDIAMHCLNRWSKFIACTVAIAFGLLLSSSGIASEKSGSEISSETEKTFRVLTFNVDRGFSDSDNRHKLAVAWIASQRPDVVALQELNNYTEEKLKEDARKWGHAYVQLCKVKSGFHLGLTSRKPITNVHLITRKGLWNGMLHGQTYGIDFFVVHLAPRPEAIRLPETDIVLSEIRRIHTAGRPSILLGDFNSRSRLDNDYYMRASEYESQYNVMDRYMNAGWIDLVNQRQGAIDERQASRPTLLVKNIWGFVRIDYILASDQLARRCIFARVMKDPATDYLSDHYPVMAEFLWNGN